MSETRIVEGDRVDMFIDDGNSLLDVEILYTPQATGDCWHLKGKNNIIFYVQTFRYMVRREVNP